MNTIPAGTIPTERDLEKYEEESELRRVDLPQKPEVAVLPYDGRHSSDTWANTIGSSTSTSARAPLGSFNRKALLTTLGGFFALFSGFGQINAFGTFQTYYAAHQLHAYTPSKISWIGSLQLWVFFFSGWGIGWLFDVYGPTRLLLSGTVCCSLGMLLTSFATKYYQLLLCQGVLFGVGVGLLFYPSLASISSHFVKYRATALGIAAAGSSLGGVVFPIILQQLYITVGFAWAVRIIALITGMLCLISVLIVTTMTPAASTAHENKKPDLACADRKGLWRLMKTTSLKDFRFVLLAMGSCFVALGLFTPFFYIVDYTSHLFPDTETAVTHFLTVATLNCGGIIGRIAPCFLSDHIGHFNLLTPSALLSGLLTLVCWLNVKSMTGVMVYTVLYGFSSGAFIAVITPCVVQITENKTQVGRRMGGLYSVISFPALVGTPIAGALLGNSSSGSFTGPIVFSGATVIVGSAFIFLAKLAVNPQMLARV